MTFSRDVTCEVVCLWVGDKYPKQYVTTLYSMLKRHLAWFHLHCITDKPAELPPQIITHPLPDDDLKGWWWKLSLFNPEYYPKLPNRFLFLDLDIVILDWIEDLFVYEQEERFVGVEDFMLKGLNSSVMRIDRGRCTEVWDKYLTLEECGRPPQYYKDSERVYAGDQNVVTTVMKDVAVYPNHWFASWKKEKGVVRNDVKILVFHGVPNPHQVKEDIVTQNWC